MDLHQGRYIWEYSEGLTAKTDGTATVQLSAKTGSPPGASQDQEPTEFFLQPGMYLIINNTPCTIGTISDDRTVLTMITPVPAGSGLQIAYSPPEFHKFGSIDIRPDPAISPTSANLPSPAIVGAGARGCVSDALNPVFGAVVAGGGANFVPVYSDGTNWRVG